MIKLLYLVLFYLIYRITDVILLLVLLVQTILNIFSGEPSDSIKSFGKSLGIYLKQISEFLSYASEEKPFPFSDWPELVSPSSEDLPSAEDLESEPEDATLNKPVSNEHEGTDVATSNENDSKPPVNDSKN